MVRPVEKESFRNGKEKRGARKASRSRGWLAATSGVTRENEWQNPEGMRTAGIKVRELFREPPRELLIPTAHPP